MEWHRWTQSDTADLESILGKMELQFRNSVALVLEEILAEVGMSFRSAKYKEK
jgi:hypothetical protein